MIKKLLLITFISQFILASEVVWLGRSPRAQLMGDAWTALSNNDEMTLFYNPASLGGNYTVEFAPLNMKLGATNALDDLDRFSDFPSEAAGIADRLLGYPVYIEASTFPGLKMLHFGFNLFATSKTSFILKNRVHPILDIDYRYDRGFATGFAYNIIGSKLARGQKIDSGTRLSVGYGLKYINREGIKNRFDLFGTGLLEIIQNGVSDISDIKNALGYAKGKAFGHDLGVEYAVGNGFSEFVFSSSLLDVGGTRFKKESKGSEDVPMQEMYWNTGFAFKQDFAFFDYALTVDVKPINAPIPISRMWHLGANLNIPFFSFYAGWSEGYLSYGGEVRLFPFTLTVGFYGVELGAEYKENIGKRAFVYLSLFDASFDIF